MMKQYKKIVICILIFYFAITISACNNKSNEFSSIQSFEYHFYPEEYEEEYSKYKKSFTLEADTDYQLQLNAVCESGTIEICISYENAENIDYIVNSETPCNDTILIPANTTNSVSFIITIQAETKGNIVGEIFICN